MKPNVINEGLKYGLIGGILFLIVNYGAWVLGSTVTFVSVVSISSFVPYVILLLIAAGLAFRKKNDNIFPYQDALKFAFIAFIVVAFTEAVGNYVLFNFIDHDLTAKVFAVSKEKVLKMMHGIGASDQQIEDAIKKMDADSKQTTFKTVFLGFGLALIWDFIKALLIALVIRKEEKFTD